MTSTQDKPKSFMQELDEWTEGAVITPLIDPVEDDPNGDFEKILQQVKKAIREKVLESYRNGQTAGPRKEVKARRYASR